MFTGLDLNKPPTGEGLPQTLDEVQPSPNPINMSEAQLSPQKNDEQPEDMSRAANMRQEVEMLMSLAPRPCSANRTID